MTHPPPSSRPDLQAQLQHTLSGSHTVERELGGGGMSRVFVAEETRLHRKVVIKVLSPELAEGLSVERFEREIQLAASMQQANIVPVLAAGDTGGLPFFAMPFVDGESLRQRLAGGPLPIAEVVSVLRDVLRALSYAHKRGIVHRDIKPDNILLSAGAAVVTDFGIAKAISAARTASHTAPLTQTGTSIGTPAYMAPEQAAGDPHVDHLADIYALGCTAYELLAGRPPFSGDSVQRIVVAQMTEAPRPVAQLRADTPAPLAALVMACLAKAPASRPQSADELIQRLDGVTSGSMVTPRSAQRSRIIAGGVAVIACIAIASFFVMRGRQQGAHLTATGARSLAVLPIENAGGDSTKEYLADGMTSELAGDLRQVPGLDVVGDMSTAQFKRSSLPPEEIAKQLHVGMLISGKLRSQGTSIRLQMQLNDASGKLLWSQTFDRQSKDNFALQDEVAAAIASSMRLVLSPVALGAARAGRTENTEAHDLFMHGEFEKNKVDSASLRRAIVYFQQALAVDPDYAKAHAGLAFAYDLLADIYAPSHEYHILALKEARLAVAADSLLAEARVLYGFELAAANWDFDGGLAEMNRGLALNPASPDALVEMAFFLLLSGHETRALALADSLVQVDPLSPLAPHVRAEALLWSGRYAEALQQKNAAMKVDPTIVLIDATDGNALVGLGRFADALAAFLNFKHISHSASFGIVDAYTRLGRPADALREIEELKARRATQYIDPMFIAIGYAEIGDRDQAMTWLQRGADEKTYPTRLFLNWDMPWLRNMQGDPRFEALKKKVLATKFSE